MLYKLIHIFTGETVRYSWLSREEVLKLNKRLASRDEPYRWVQAEKVKTGRRK